MCMFVACELHLLYICFFSITPDKNMHLCVCTLCVCVSFISYPNVRVRYRSVMMEVQMMGR